MSEKMKARCQAVAVRFVADTRTGEFLNIGVVLFCPSLRYAGAKFLSSWARISNAFPSADLVHLRRLKRLFEHACEGWMANTQQPELFASVDGVAGLLRLVMAPDDATIQFSTPLSGITANPEVTLAELFTTYVGKEVGDSSVEGRDDDAIWRALVQKLAKPEVVRAMQPHTLRSSHYEQVFERSWKNGAWNAAQPLSFDMRDPQSIREKALLWSSKIHELRPSENDTTIHFLVGMPDEHRPKEIRKAAQDAFAILEDMTEADGGKVVSESDADDLAKKIEEDVAHRAEIFRH